MSLTDLMLGKPLATSEERAEHIGPMASIPVFGLDALSSAAYGPEAALTLLIPLGLLGVREIVPISLAILILLAIVFFSYLQTIDAYPHGGGSYTVATENLGDGAGRGDLSWGGRVGVGSAGPAAVYAGAVPADSCRVDAGECARGA